MKQFGFLFFIFVFIITGCDTKSDMGANSNTDGQKSIPISTPTPVPTPIPTPTPITATSTHENQEVTNRIENEKSFKYYELSPVDQANEVKGLIEFRDELITNIKERNIDFLYTCFDEQGKWDFGGTTKEQLLEIWNEASWLELQKAVLLGGAFYDEKKTTFISPYIFSLFPHELDAYEFEVATKDQVEVYIQKDVDSNVIEMLNYTIVKRIHEDNDSNWKKIEMSDGRVGYVIGDSIRSPIDYRVGFDKVNDDWKITFFLAGD